MAWSKSSGVAFLTPVEVVVWLDSRNPKALQQVRAAWAHREAERLKRRGTKEKGGGGDNAASGQGNAACPGRLRFWAVD